MSDLKVTYNQQQQLQQDVPYYYPMIDVSSGKIIIAKLGKKERFTYITYQIFISFLEHADTENLLDIPEINNTLLSKDTIDKITGIEFINPLVYILGYLITKDTKKQEIDKKNFIKISSYVISDDTNPDPLLSKIHNLNIDTISKPDILRYSRYWKEKLW